MQNTSEKSNNIRFRTYNFSLEIIELVKSFPQTKIYLIFADQLLRSATSIGANVLKPNHQVREKILIDSMKSL